MPTVRDFPFEAFDDFSPQKERVEMKNGKLAVVIPSSIEVQQRVFFFCKCSVHSSSNRSSFSEQCAS